LPSKNNSEANWLKCPNGDECEDFKIGECRYVHKNEEVKKDGSHWRDKKPPKDLQRKMPHNNPDEEVKGEQGRFMR
jgi:hypothetical protein